MAKNEEPTASHLPPPTEREQRAIREAVARNEQREEPVSVSWKGEAIFTPHSDEAGHFAQLAEAFGTRSFSFMSANLSDLELVSRKRRGKIGETDVNLNAALALISAITPKDELEAALAAQMAGCQALAMEMLWRAKQTDQMPHIQLYGGLAVKLQRTFTAQVEALAKLRGGGKQEVTVTHVHQHVYVGSGGKAVVGDVYPGGGGDHQIRDQCHEPITGPPVTERCPVWRENKARDAVSVTGDAFEKEVPHSRREGGRPSG